MVSASRAHRSQALFGFDVARRNRLGRVSWLERSGNPHRETHHQRITDPSAITNA